MFSKEEAAFIRKDFWISFGKSFPRKWILYKTNIKDCAFKFEANGNNAMVCFDIASSDDIKNELLFEQFYTLKTILQEEYVSDVIFEKSFELENGKRIHRIYAKYKSTFHIHNKNTWKEVFEFFYTTMHSFELFYLEYEDYLKEVIN